MRLHMLKLCVGNGRQIMQYYATVAIERAVYVLYRALVVNGTTTLNFFSQPATYLPVLILSFQLGSLDSILKKVHDS